MSDRFYGDIFGGTTGVSIDVILRSNVDNTPSLNVQAAAIAAVYYRQGDPAVVTIPVTQLGAVNSAWTPGGWRVINDTSMPGRYRLDVPDLAWATGADWVAIQVREALSFNFEANFRIQSQALIRVGLVA